MGHKSSPSRPGDRPCDTHRPLRGGAAGKSMAKESGELSSGSLLDFQWDGSP